MRFRWHLAGLIVLLLALPGRAESAAPALRPVAAAKGPAASAANLPSDAIPSEPEASPFPHSALGDEGVRSQPDPGAGPGAAAPKAQPQGMDYPRVFIALGAVIALIFVLRGFGRYFFPAVTGRAANRAIEVLSRSPLSPKQQVMLIRVGRRVIVVGDTGGQLNALCEITDPDEVAALVGQLRDEKSPSAGGAFGTMFGRSRRNFESAEAAPDVRPAPLAEDEDSAPVATARDELNGLRDRVRLLSEQFK